MNPILAARVADAVSALLMVDVDVRAPGGSWVTVRGLERKASTPQRPDGMITQMLTESDAVHLLARDWPAATRPGKGWQVRFPVVVNGVRLADGVVRTITEPMSTVDSAGQFLGAPLT